MESCPRCTGFVPAQLSRCPHCAETLQTSGWLRTVLFAGTAFTLSACYGPAPRHSPMVEPTCRAEQDLDHDGYCPPQDCNDQDNESFPGASERPGDNIDQNCDGTRD